jgi:FkbM family methyltransferase
MHEPASSGRPSIAEDVRRAKTLPIVALVRQLLRPETTTLDGVRVITARSSLPRRQARPIYKGTYEAPERAIVQRLLAKGDRVLEGGACLGVVSMIAAKIVGAENIVSYEPFPRSFELLQQNLKLNGLAIRCKQGALAATGGTIRFYVSDNPLGNSAVYRDGRSTIEVPAFGIAEAAAEISANTLLLDIEGAETEVIAAAPLQQFDKISMEVHPAVTGEEPIRRMWQQLKDNGLEEVPELSFEQTYTFLRR